MISDASRPPSLSGAFAALATSDWHPHAVPRHQFLEEEECRPSSDVDWQLVVSLRRQAAEQIGQASERWLTEHGTVMPEDDRRVQGRAIIRTVVHAHAERLSSEGAALWPLELETGYAEAVAQAIFGYGRLSPVLSIPEAENIEITGWDSVMIQYGDGHRESHPPVADSDEELIEAVRFLGETANPPRPFDDAHPTMTLALGSRFRLHAIGFGLSHRPSVIIRQHTLTSVTLKELADDGMLPVPLARLLAQAVLARKSIVISGDQGAGKTTLLRALIAEIPPNERFGTLETDYELLTHLQPGRRNMLALQAKVGLGEQQGDRHVGGVDRGGSHSRGAAAEPVPAGGRGGPGRRSGGDVRGDAGGCRYSLDHPLALRPFHHRPLGGPCRVGRGTERRGGDAADRPQHQFHRPRDPARRHLARRCQATFRQRGATTDRGRREQPSHHPPRLSIRSGSTVPA